MNVGELIGAMGGGAQTKVQEYYANYNEETGEYQGFYAKELHENIPLPYIILTPGQHREAINNQGYYKVINGEHTYSPPPPPSVEELKTSKRQLINATRDTKEQGGFVHNGKVYDSDPTSVQRIAIAAQNALAAKLSGAPFEIVWTLADNSTVTLGADAMLGVSQALAVHAATVHEIAKGMKEAVARAATAEEVEKITWP